MRKKSKGESQGANEPDCKQQSKSVVFVADLHVGARTGLAYQPMNAVQEELFECWEEDTQRFGKPDILVVNGDAIDGKGNKEGGLDTLLNDPYQQAKQAISLLEMWGAKTTLILAGTSYHVAGDTDFEQFIADAFKGSLHSKLRLNVSGYVFDIRHAIGRSVIPHGRFTAPAREKIWDALSTETSSRKQASAIIRSHVHYWTVSQDAFGLAMTLPCWQARGSRFGARQCTGHIDIGCVRFEIDNQGGAKWEARRHQLQADRCPEVRL